MPRTVTELRVFVASPDDVSEEKDRLSEAIDGINKTIGRSLGIRLELVQWETDTIPGVGESPQAVINDQIGDDYDIFIMILWVKLGTPTATAESGTVEEYERAMARVEKGDDVIVMAYFKESLPSSNIGDLDFKEMQRVQEFKSKLSNTTNYRSFDTPDGFGQKVRTHLSQLLIARSSDTTNGNIENDTVDGQDADGDVAADEDDIDPLGVLDLRELVEVEFGDMNDVLHRMAELNVEWTNKMSEHTKKFHSFAESGAMQRPGGAKRAKRLVNDTAADMLDFASGIDNALPTMKEKMANGLEAVETLAPMLDDQESIASNLYSLIGMRNSMESASEQIAVLIGSIEDLDSMTTALNRAKRLSRRALRGVIDCWRGAIKRLHRIEQQIRDSSDLRTDDDAMRIAPNSGNLVASIISRQNSVADAERFYDLFMSQSNKTDPYSPPCAFAAILVAHDDMVRADSILRETQDAADEAGEGDLFDVVRDLHYLIDDDDNEEVSG